MKNNNVNNKKSHRIVPIFSSFYFRDLLLDAMPTVEEADEVVTFIKTLNNKWNLEKVYSQTYTDRNKYM